MTLKRTSAFLKTHVRHSTSKRTAISPVTGLDQSLADTQSPSSFAQQQHHTHKATTAHNTLTEPLAPCAVASQQHTGEDGKVRTPVGSARGSGKGKEREDVDEREEKTEALLQREILDARGTLSPRQQTHDDAAAIKEEKRKLQKLHEYRASRQHQQQHHKHRPLHRLKQKARGVIPFRTTDANERGAPVSPMSDICFDTETDYIVVPAIPPSLPQQEVREEDEEETAMKPRQKTQRAIEKEWNRLNAAQKMDRVITQTYNEVFTSVSVVFETRRAYWHAMNSNQRAYIQALEKECWLLEERADEIRERGRTDNAEVKEIQSAVWAIKCDVLIHFAPLWQWDSQEAVAGASSSVIQPEDKKMFAQYLGDEDDDLLSMDYDDANDDFETSTPPSSSSKW